MGHVIAGYVSAREKAYVNVLTRNPEKWSTELSISMPDGSMLTSNLNVVSSNPIDVIPKSDVVLICLPGYAIPSELDLIAPCLTAGTMVGTVFSSTGFFQEAFKRLPENVGLWGLQRVPYVSRVEEYGKSAHLLGFRDCLHLAVERCDASEEFKDMISAWLDEPVKLLGNWIEAAVTNSNPLLHTSRLYTMFKDWTPNRFYPRQFLFYEEWTDEASRLLVEMDQELFSLIGKMPVHPGYIETILEHYESKTPEDITRKIHSISGFKGLTTPMVETDKGWIPDLKSRYFVEDFQYGLKYIKQLMKEYGVASPRIDEVMNWYSIISNQ